MEGDGYNFAQLKREILARSSAKVWEVAKSEWRLVGIHEADEPNTCLCGHHPIKEICTIRNGITDLVTDVGNVCINRFFGIRSDKIFAAVKRIRRNVDKSLNAEAIVHFHSMGVINDWEYGFSQNTFRKRELSAAQLRTRQKINHKVLWTMRGR